MPPKSLLRKCGVGDGGDKLILKCCPAGQRRSGMASQELKSSPERKFLNAIFRRRPGGYLGPKSLRASRQIHG